MRTARVLHDCAIRFDNLNVNGITPPLSDLASSTECIKGRLFDRVESGWRPRGHGDDYRPGPLAASPSFDGFALSSDYTRTLAGRYDAVKRSMDVASAGR